MIEEERREVTPAPIPRPSIVPEPEEEPEEEEEPGAKDAMSDLVEVTEEDVMGKPSDNVEQGLDEEDDMEDLVEVGDLFEDREPEKPKPKPRYIIRRPPVPPQTSGLR